MEFFELMKSACDKVEMSFDEKTYNKFITYKDLLKEWNEKINLTAITEDEEIIKKHFIDCINAFKLDEFKKCKSVIDVGTGAGFPGLPIAIMKTDINVTLLDSLNKRINFLNQIKTSLNLDNVVTIHSRAEDGARQKDLREKFDIATSRAVANMSVLSEFCIPYVKVGGYFIALKGPSIDEELEEAKKAIGMLGGKLLQVISVDIEGTDLNHNLVVIKKVKATPNVYPRKAGTITKKPLK
ncbi:16S rRNA m(7)G-527 methyltransferase [Clostridium cavendishii DSM 21758]|uniref:Ribosomal RNA small subunit methyltransferase G n=1 Tax=Clostridium cavendishii DSM 21758 TaxID=1121302 RepID=A0A1M6TLA3_9CLOT|nr:16S rRNA (guanine(527)-N(7))-methyltransferase RsmG [Clostridium cavendishii]SHK57538.1 16S rRNA m(7)G-527 methyltransferase [Clostridium cavendishii DSM 21758]